MATTTMATKRKRGDDNQAIKSPEALRELLNSNITTYESAEIALLHIMAGYDFSLSHLQQIFMGMAILFSF
jgi:cell division GTPase FtsZ